MKRKYILWVIFLLILALVSAYTVDRIRMRRNLPVIFSTWSYSYAPPAESLPAQTDKDGSFLGTVLEETFSYMLIAPDEGERERETAEVIKIEYITDHIDFIYGLGRKVVIYYDGNIMPGNPPVIRTDDISTEGFRDFTLSVLPNEAAGKKQVIRESAPHDNDFGYYRPHNLYYYGLDEVLVYTDGQTLPLADAIEAGKITTTAILSKANRDVASGAAHELRYKDGGSVIFQYPDYTIIKYKTIDGNHDMYIGAPGINISVKDK